jgi:pyruvate,water dikinase
MAKQIVSDQELVDSLCHDDRADAEQKLLAIPELEKAYRDYLEQFGDRCLEELKLESATLVDDPMPLLRSIGHTARRLRDESTAPKPFRPREAAEKQVRDAMRKHPLKRALFNWVLKNARGRVRDRENLRFERTRLFGRVRRIFVEVGRRFYAEGLLESDRDVFYLTIEEALGYVEGTCVLENLRELTQLRKRQFEGYANPVVPAERFETRGAVYLGNQFQSVVKSNPANVEGDLKGIGCCPGIVRGPVRVIRDPRGAEIQHGEILVAERTDPGWIMLFPSAAGVLVERGSLLSHSAIVAREMGIPAVVSIPGLMQSLVDGQWVEMDGSLGTIRKISEGETTWVRRSR